MAKLETRKTGIAGETSAGIGNNGMKPHHLRKRSKRLGDMNGDGIPDVYASDFTNGAKGASTGRIYVHSGRDGKRLVTLTGEGAGEGAGSMARVVTP